MSRSKISLRDLLIEGRISHDSKENLKLALLPYEMPEIMENGSEIMIYPTDVFLSLVRKKELYPDKSIREIDISARANPIIDYASVYDYVEFKLGEEIYHLYMSPQSRSRNGIKKPKKITIDILV